MAYPQNSGTSQVVFCPNKQHSFEPFWAYPENSHVVFCPNKQRSLEPFYVFGSCFRTLAVILVSGFLSENDWSKGQTERHDAR